MKDNNCVFCIRDEAENSLCKKFIIDNDEKVVDIVFIDDKPFIEVGKNIGSSNSYGGDDWVFSRAPIKFCTECGRKLI